MKYYMTVKQEYSLKRGVIIKISIKKKYICLHFCFVYDETEL